MQKHVMNPVAEAILRGDVQPGGQVYVDCVDEHFFVRTGERAGESVDGPAQRADGPAQDESSALPV
jgi:hypothetical protein